MLNEDLVIKKTVVENISAANFGNELIPIYDTLQSYKNLEQGLEKVKWDILNLLDADLFTIYQNVLNGKELKSYYRAGPVSDLRELNMIVPYSPTSPAGYVALSHRSILIEDVNNKEKLFNIHPHLQCTENNYKKHKEGLIKSMIVVPIKDKTFFGVLQVMTQEGHQGFTKKDISKINVLSHILAKLLRPTLQLKHAHGPYDYLIQMGKLSSNQLNEAKKAAFQNSNKISKILVEDYEIEADDLGMSLENYYRVPYMKYDASVRPPSIFMENIENNYLKKNLWIPISGNKEEVVILIDDPSDQQRIFEIDKIINAKNYVIKVGLPEHILQFLEDDGDNTLKSSFANLFKVLEEKENYEVLEEEPEIDDGENLASSSVIIRLVKRIIIEADDLGSSDIHFEPGDNHSPGIVRVRVDGDCRVLQEIPREYMPAMIARIKVISGMDISERRLPQDGKCVETIRGRKIELRVATYPTNGGESAVLRILSHNSVMPLEKLNLSQPNLERIKKLSSNLHGMFLVVGPTGAGKTVTSHAVLQYLNKLDIKIWTAEDPVEITQPGLQQIQMKPKIGLTFATAMRSFLRGDPDVILVGEIRDKETASIAIQGSLTGHLVLSTLHSNSATETITRLLNLGMEPVDFSDALLGIMAQRLVKTLCDNCKESYTPSNKELDFLIDRYGREFFPDLNINKEDIQLCRPVGCEKCEDSGYNGRTGIHELLVVSMDLQQMIFNQASQKDIKTQAIKDGMRTLKQDGIHKVFLGLTDYKQLNRVVSD